MCRTPDPVFAAVFRPTFGIMKVHSRKYRSGFILVLLSIRRSNQLLLHMNEGETRSSS